MRLTIQIKHLPAFSVLRSDELRSLLRMSLVVAASIAVLISLPKLIRSFEQGSWGVTGSMPVSPLEIESPASMPVVLPSSAKDAVRHDMLADFLAKRYRVSREALERFVGLAHAAGQMTKVDPLLILAVMAVESSFNPIAESVMGAKGLMQIIPQYHQDKLMTPQGTSLNVLDPEINILAGAKVLREYATRTGEDLVAALRLYGGTGPGGEDAYSSKVLSERQQLEQVARRAQERSRAQATKPGQRT
jgi:soluble lytic murein transglycosylase-like protein